ncbi:MAG: PrsW family intramembrane metalloprotease, partial [Patescibacteria group bacterium]|nr:PrsW family intramembrane metalloprotease [Patescibacteria group bacterium]
KTVFNQPIDAMFFMIIAALGFATVENIIALLGEVLSAPNYALSIQDVTQLAALRFIGATLVHALSSGIVGFYWAKSIERFFAKKYLVFGIILGVLVHALFNWMILYLSSIIYAIIILAIIGLFVLNDFEKLKRRAV